MSIFNFKRYFSARRARSITNKVNLERDEESLQVILTEIEEISKKGKTIFETEATTRTKWIEKKLVKLGYTVKSSETKSSNITFFSITW